MYVKMTVLHTKKLSGNFVILAFPAVLARGFWSYINLDINLVPVKMRRLRKRFFPLPPRDGTYVITDTLLLQHRSLAFVSYSTDNNSS